MTLAYSSCTALSKTGASNQIALMVIIKIFMTFHQYRNIMALSPRLSLSRIEEAWQSHGRIFGYASLKNEQKTVITNFILGNEFSQCCQPRCQLVWHSQSVLRSKYSHHSLH